MTAQSHFMLIFLIPKGQFTKSHQLRKVTLVDFDCRLLIRWPLFCKSLVRVVFLRTKFGGFIVFYLFSKIVYLLKIMVHCILITQYAEKLCCEWTTLFTLIVADTQRRLIPHSSLMKDKKGKNPPNEFPLYSVHRNHVEWLCGITPTPYHECSRSHQLRTMNDRGHINSVPWMYAVTLTPYHEWPGSYQLRTMNARSLSTTSSHFHSDRLRTFMVRSWCDPGHSWYGVDAIL